MSGVTVATGRRSDAAVRCEVQMRNGAQLGWLIDPPRRAVHVYRPGEPVQSLLGPSTVSAEPLLRGFVLDLAALL